MKTNYTPGTWNINTEIDSIVYSDSTQQAVALVGNVRTKSSRNLEQVGFSATSIEESEANAKLIASAPDLLEKLNRVESTLINLINEGRIEFRPLLESVRQSIQKATE